MHHPFRSRSTRRPLRFSVLLALLLVGLVGLRPPPAALAACGGSATVVSNTAELNAAITAFNAVDAACDFTIQLTSEITLSDNLVEIANNTDDVTLTINGDGRSLNGAWLYETFTMTASDVTINDLHLRGSRVDGIVATGGSLRIVDSYIFGHSFSGIVVNQGELLVANTAIAGNGSDGISATGATTLRVINTTIAGNVSTGMDVAGGTALVTHVTIIDNSVGFRGASSENTINNSILADNVGSDCSLTSSTTFFNFSLIEGVGECTTASYVGTIFGADPQLLPFDDYGGHTPTAPPAFGSSALNTGSNTLSLDEEGNTLGTDQRGDGFPRRIGDLVDMGAAESSCATVMSVGDTDDYQNAIRCFNAATEAGDYTINQTDEITLNADLVPIQNDTSDVTLIINGGHRSLQGALTYDTFVITSSNVTINDLAINGSGDDGIEASRSNLHVNGSHILRSDQNGIYVTDTALIVTDSAITGNSGAGIDSVAPGRNTMINVINTTVAGNRIGVYSMWGFLRLNHVSIVGNDLYGLRVIGSDTFVINSILAYSAGSDCTFNTQDGIFHNTLIEDASCDFWGMDNITGQDPKLLPLDDYGGYVPTAPPAFGSPALNTGSNTLSLDEEGNTLGTDQRGDGFPRRRYGVVDMGAAESICAATMDVGTSDELRAAFHCFNMAPTPQAYTITLTDDITLTDSPPDISNSTAGISLLIDGGGFTLDGDGFNDTIRIVNTPRVSISNITVANGFRDGIYADSTDLLLSDATLRNNVYHGIAFRNGDLVIRNSALVSNRSSGVQATPSAGEPTTATLINTTVVGNGSTGIYGYFIDRLQLTHVTVVGNLIGLFVLDVDDVVIDNSILAGNNDGVPEGNAIDCINADSTSSIDINHSLVQIDHHNNPCGASNVDGNITGQEAGLLPLGNYGGPTLTAPPSDDSPAIDAGNDDLAVDEKGDDLLTDQRGEAFPRRLGGSVDMGAVETDVDYAVYLSAATSGTTADGLTFDNSDILKWDGTAWSLAFDGSAALLAPKKSKHNINAFWISDDEVIMAFSQNARKVGDLSDKVDGTDLVSWDGAVWSLWFDGSDVGLEKKGAEKIDGLHVLPGSDAPSLFDGVTCLHYLLISTQGSGVVTDYPGGRLKFSGEDVLGFCMTNFGATTAGFWHLLLDGSAEGVKKNAIDSISISAGGQTLYLTSKGSFKVDAADGNHSSVYAYDMTTGVFSGPDFIAADNGLKVKVDGLQMN